MQQARLRDIKKAETKADLSRAALDLSLSQGFDAVTVDAIAAAAHVSARTFRNYFSSKEQAILNLLEQVEESQAEAFMRRDPSESVLVSLEEVAVELVDSGDTFDQTVQVSRLISDHPALTAHAAAVTDPIAATRVVTEIGRRTGMDPDTEMYPRLVYNANRAVTATVVTLLITGRQLPGSPVDLVRSGFAQLRRGLLDAVTVIPPGAAGFSR